MSSASSHSGTDLKPVEDQLPPLKMLTHGPAKALRICTMLVMHPDDKDLLCYHLCGQSLAAGTDTCSS